MKRSRMSIGHEERDEEDAAVQELVSPIHRVCIRRGEAFVGPVYADGASKIRHRQFASRVLRLQTLQNRSAINCRSRRPRLLGKTWSGTESDSRGIGVNKANSIPQKPREERKYPDVAQPAAYDKIAGSSAKRNMHVIHSLEPPSSRKVSLRVPVPSPRPQRHSGEGEKRLCFSLLSWSCRRDASRNYVSEPGLSIISASLGTTCLCRGGSEQA
ncbi:hypothetical protein VTN77DRAFT_9270 [Rasamsonia byssochlamydoides]|uniref:uncharacterized protein n=1 Tax=Rasamsonia byssochlamydoides TaxID=89139 RepID=UPI003742123C